MPCLAQELHPRPAAAASNYCKSLSSLIRETYAHCHVPCVRVPAGAAGWSSGEDSDDDDGSGLDEALDTKQVVLAEMRKRSRCSQLDSPTLPLTSAAFAWSYTPLDPRTVLEKVSSPKTCVVVEGTDEKAKEEEAAEDDGDADDESEAFFSVKSFFTRSTSRAATVASSAAGMMMEMDPPPPMLRSPEAWERFRDCEGWPFGLCRRPAVLPLPPLPSTPADSWKWRKSASSGFAASPAPAYTHKLASK
ncbi:uncharacterized protein LOC120681327 [Panicum virgatum]|uniref:Uncharacterized protein n=1 Tax=Panicum virgatum TaxID=38727 RepID=A0A8T0WGV4_PANVG|nr:uncharacterized protein LOC120681327 [Panicum virgatum]KAG2643873.1 hypothetical protein PVAP13_2KG352700 [Panicum virgatum]